MQKPSLSPHSEAERFDRGVRKILSVSHDEVKRREEQWKRERVGKAKPGPKPNLPSEKRNNQRSLTI